MRLGVFTSLTLQTWAGVLDLWRHIESTGWDIACVTDHFMPNTRNPVDDTLECWTALSGLALSTQRLRIGTLVVGNTYRHPAVVAKMAATVDIMSGGRLICGIGAAWQRNEHTAYGIPYYTVGERLNRLEEACQVLLGLWTQPTTTFNGKYYQLTEAPLFPKPLQQPHPELLIGGGGEQRTLRIAAKYADHWNVWGGPETLRHKGEVLARHCDAVGRDPAQILRVVRRFDDAAKLAVVAAADLLGQLGNRSLQSLVHHQNSFPIRSTALTASELALRISAKDCS